VNVATIAAANYVPHVRVLAESLRAHHPEARVHALFVDGAVNGEGEPFEPLEPAALGLESFGRMAAMYDVLELCTAVKPALLTRLLAEHERVIYLDPDIKVYAPLDAALAALDGANVLLTPHTMVPLPDDGHMPSDLDVLRAGSFNLGFLGLRRGHETARLLDWWSAKLAVHCLDDVYRGLYVDQRWMDLAASMFEGVQVLRDPSFNVAYWNLSERRLTRGAAGWEIDGAPMRFFHFSAFDPRVPEVFSAHQDRLLPREHPDVAAVYREYAEDLRAHGLRAAGRRAYGFAVTASGIALTRALRRLYREGVLAGELRLSPFEPAGERAFLDWLNQPAPVGANAGVTRYLHRLWELRPDVQRAHPDLDGPDGPDFLNWARWYGREDYEIPEELLCAGPSEPAPPAAPWGRLRRLARRVAPSAFLVGLR
jgi:hypothetical protein